MGFSDPPCFSLKNQTAKPCLCFSGICRDCWRNQSRRGCTCKTTCRGWSPTAIDGTGLLSRGFIAFLDSYLSALDPLILGRKFPPKKTHRRWSILWFFLLEKINQKEYHGLSFESPVFLVKHWDLLKKTAWSHLHPCPPGHLGFGDPMLCAQQDELQHFAWDDKRWLINFTLKVSLLENYRRFAGDDIHPESPGTSQSFFLATKLLWWSILCANSLCFVSIMAHTSWSDPAAKFSTKNQPKQISHFTVDPYKQASHQGENNTNGETKPDWK